MADSSEPTSAPATPPGSATALEAETRDKEEEGAPTSVVCVSAADKVETTPRVSVEAGTVASGSVEASAAAEAGAAASLKSGGASGDVGSLNKVSKAAADGSVDPAPVVRTSAGLNGARLASPEREMSDMSSDELAELDALFEQLLCDIRADNRWMPDAEVRSQAIVETRIFCRPQFKNATFLANRFGGPFDRRSVKASGDEDYADDDGDGFFRPAPGYCYDDDEPRREHGYYAGGEWYDWDECYGDSY
jgi:hypothetical protein